MGKNLNKFQLIVLQRIADHKEAERIKEEAAKAVKQPEPEPDELPLAAEKPAQVATESKTQTAQFRPLEWNVSLRHANDLKAIKSIIGDAEYSEMLHDNNGNEYELQITIKRVAIKKAVAA